MTRPHVFTARNTQKTPITFIISPVFTWKKQGQSQHPGVIQGVRTEVNGTLGTSAWRMGQGLVCWASHPWAVLCVHPTFRQSNVTPSKCYRCSEHPPGKLCLSGHLQN